MKIHHIGLIVKNVEKNISIFEKLGYTKVSDIITDNHQNIRVVFVQSSDQSQLLELIESLDETSSIYRFKDGYHHICYEVECNQSFLEDFKKLKIGKIFTKPIEAPAINNRVVIFGCLNNGVFVEFLF
jgi:hypothetical protein